VPAAPPDSPPRSPWWHPDTHADRRPFLLARGAIQAALRDWFDRQGFLEVDPAILQVSPGNETHLHAFATNMVGPDGSRRPLYLHTSPEFACKKLLAAGETRIFTFAPSFRNRERGALHHPAFTMLEWYRAREPYERLMQDCVELLRVAALPGHDEGAFERPLCDRRMSLRVGSDKAQHQVQLELELRIHATCALERVHRSAREPPTSCMRTSSKTPVRAACGGTISIRAGGWRALRRSRRASGPSVGTARSS